MGYAASYLSEKLIISDHPEKIGKKCLRHIRAGENCEACQKVCHRHVFDQDEPRWELCDNCGICVSSCPSGCILPSQSDIRRILNLAGKKEKNLLISCDMRDEESHMSVPCLAALPTELLTILGLRGKVVCVKGDCENCQYAESMYMFESHMRQANGRLMAEKILVGDKKSDIKIAPERYDRREAFGLWLRGTSVFISALLPTSVTELSSHHIYRVMYGNLLRQKDTGVSLKLPVIRNANGCSGCGICEKICPHDAIHLVRDQRDDSQWYFAWLGQMCTGCGLCIRTCMEKTLSVERETCDLPLRPYVFPIGQGSCKRCHRPLAGAKGEFCNMCSQEMRWNR